MAYFNRFKPDAFPKVEVYEELQTVLEAERPRSIIVPLREMDLNFEKGSIIVAGQDMPLGERGQSTLYDRLGLGRVPSMLSPETMKLVRADMVEYLKTTAEDDSLVLKVKNVGGEDTVMGVVTERYREIPHTDVLSIMEHLGAYPIRVYHNDYILRMQAIFDDYTINPRDGEPLNLGVQVRSSDMGAAALNFDVFTYRWICDNGCVMGKKVVGNVRTVHVNSLEQAEYDTKRHIEIVLNEAQGKLENIINGMIGRSVNHAQVVEFLARLPIGKKAQAAIVERIAGNKTQWDTFNELTMAGHDPSFSNTVQNHLEVAAGNFMQLAA